jgi:predicted CoA-substrate-specific enzyme activase
MISAGIDIGSLTAKAVIMKDGHIISHSIIRSMPDPEKSALKVMDKTLSNISLVYGQISACCSTGYGREGISFAKRNLSEITCHAAGAFWMNDRIRTVIDIGGQDCKVISLDGKGKVLDFIMNDKCAAGTGRSLELLSRTLGVSLEELGLLSIKSKKPAEISNKCSIFMELEVLQHIYKKKTTGDIAAGIAEAVAKRVAALTCQIDMKNGICVTGGVSKNAGVIKYLENLLNMKFEKLSNDPQLAGAIGAALFASGMAVL